MKLLRRLIILAVSIYVHDIRLHEKVSLNRNYQGTYHLKDTGQPVKKYQTN